MPQYHPTHHDTFAVGDSDAGVAGSMRRIERLIDKHVAGNTSVKPSLLQRLELTPDEVRRQLRTAPSSAPEVDFSKASFAELDRLVERGKDTWFRVGLALTAIRERQLYTQHFGTFEAYCQAKFGTNGNKGMRLARAAMATLDSGFTGGGPANAHQANMLAAVPAPKRKRAWAKARSLAEQEGRSVTGEHVTRAARIVQDQPDFDVDREVQIISRSITRACRRCPAGLHVDFCTALSKAVDDVLKSE